VRYTFDALREDHLGMVRRWLLEPHVSRWWDDGAHDPYPDGVLDHYRKAIRGEDATDHHIIEIDGRPSGLIQSYRIDDDLEYARALALGEAAIGVDLFIGAPALVGRGHGAALLRRYLLDVAFPKLGLDVCVIGPSVTNVAAIRAYEKAGFTRLREAVVPGEKDPELLMRVTRNEIEDLAHH